MRLLAISGSLRAASSNGAALRALQRLAPPGVEVVLYDGLGGLPHFNPDLDGDAPPAPVAALRAAVGRADGLVISSPEYARGVPGSLKNALDWLVSSFEFPGKPVVLINTSQRAEHAQAALRLTLETMSAHLLADASITLPLLGRGIDADGIVAEPGLAGPLGAVFAGFRQATRRSTEG